MLGTSPTANFWNAIKEIRSARFSFEVRIEKSSSSETVWNIVKNYDSKEYNFVKIIHSENSFDEAVQWCKYHRMEVKNATN